MDYFLQFFTIAHTLTAYRSIELNKLSQAHFFPSSNLNFDEIESNVNNLTEIFLHTYLPFFPKSKFRQVLGKWGWTNTSCISICNSLGIP